MNSVPSMVAIFLLILARSSLIVCMFMMKFFPILLCFFVGIALFFLIVGNDKPNNLEDKVSDLKEYCIKNGYSTDIAVLVDYGAHFGKVRFFVWDFKKEKVVLSSICAQGCGKGKNLGKNVFSNKVGSLCSSLGHYEIGAKRKMLKGTRTAYTLYGLDETNSNALKRGILLHPVHLPGFSIYPFEIPEKKYKIFRWTIRPFSEGCITIPFVKFYRLQNILDKTNGNVIMWVYK